MDVDDPFDEVARVATTGAAALSRAAEVLIRRAQDSKIRQAGATARVTEDLQRRAEAQASSAERYYARAGDPEWVRSTGAEDVALAWHGSRQWAQIDPDRFTAHAERIDAAVRKETGIDFSDPEQRHGLNVNNTRTLAGEPLTSAPTSSAGVGEDGVTVTSPAYDTAERRAATDSRLEAAGVSPKAREARMLSDQFNATDPGQVHSVVKHGKRGAGSTAIPHKARTGRNAERDHGRGR